MELAVIIELIGTVGFPIVCVLALGIFVYKLWQQSAEREKTLMTEIAENRMVNQKAIETISQYAERLTHIEDNVADIKSDVVEIKQKIN